VSRKIGSITPIWNQGLWIKPHFEMLSSLDKNVVLMHKRPLPNYHKEHGYSIEPDNSEELLRKEFPKVEIYEAIYPEGQEFGPDIYNEGLKYLQDCDIVFRLDPDMFFEDQAWKDLLDYIRNTTYDCYKMDFANDSMNYYMTGDFDHGLKDAKEMDPLAFNPKNRLIWGEHGFDCNTENSTIIKFPGFFCHHFRGWNKPKSTPNPEWKNSDYARIALQLYGDNGAWYTCPQSIRDKIGGVKSE
jgi:hypothetical protein